MHANIDFEGKAANESYNSRIGKTFIYSFFRLVDRIDDRILFVAASASMRIVEAIGTSVSVVTGFSLVASQFPDNFTTIFVSYSIVLVSALTAW